LTPHGLGLVHGWHHRCQDGILLGNRRCPWHRNDPSPSLAPPTVLLGEGLQDYLHGPQPQGCCHVLLLLLPDGHYTLTLAHWLSSRRPSWLAKDPRQEVKKILQFLGKEVAEGTVERILHNTTFRAMKKNPAANYETMPSALMDHSLSPFLHKRICGDWKNHFTVAQNEHFDQHYHGRLRPPLPDGDVRGSSPFPGGLCFSLLPWCGWWVQVEHPCTDLLFPLQ
ncbi:PREDICTED: estrogen sulfotransferase-like, partial [Lepidothrix coronata]|uniref:Sulfotransferase n=1 Tax=Lepidothrix coronata TaxID=321398 RepID=A0A6J0GH95_9PASS